jgi:hypothetical protein
MSVAPGLENGAGAILEAARVLGRESGGRILLRGSGGGAADTQPIAAECERPESELSHGPAREGAQTNARSHRLQYGDAPAQFGIGGKATDLAGFAIQ